MTLGLGFRGVPAAHAVPRVALVVNEITQESRAALLDGYAVMVICTPLDRLCADTVELMVSTVNSGEPGMSAQHFLEPRIILPEIL